MVVILRMNSRVISILRGSVDRGTASNMVIRGEPDQATASLADWTAYRDHLRSLPDKDESVSVALAVAHAQIQKLQQPEDRAVNV